MRIVILVLLFITILHATEYKAVFNLSSGEDKSIKGSIINNITLLQKHYSKQGDSLKAVVVISGNAYQYFIKEKKKNFKNELSTLATSGVKFEVCSMGMKKRKILASDLDIYAKPVFNRTFALIQWQNRGYALIDVK